MYRQPQLPAGHSDFRPDPLKIRALDRRVKFANRLVPGRDSAAWTDHAQETNRRDLLAGLYSPVTIAN